MKRVPVSRIIVDKHVWRTGKDGVSRRYNVTLHATKGWRCQYDPA